MMANLEINSAKSIAKKKCTLNALFWVLMQCYLYLFFVALLNFMVIDLSSFQGALI